MGEDRGCYGWNPGDGYFAGEGRVAEDLRGGIEVANGVSGDDHDCFLGLGTVSGVRVLVVGVGWGGGD